MPSSQPTTILVNYFYGIKGCKGVVKGRAIVSQHKQARRKGHLCHGRLRRSDLLDTVSFLNHKLSLFLPSICTHTGAAYIGSNRGWKSNRRGIRCKSSPRMDQGPLVSTFKISSYEENRNSTCPFSISMVRGGREAFQDLETNDLITSMGGGRRKKRLTKLNFQCSRHFSKFSSSKQMKSADELMIRSK